MRVFRDLPPDLNDQRTRVLLEQQLKAAQSIIGYLVCQAGGSVTLPYSVWGQRYALGVVSNSLDKTIEVTSRIKDGLY